VKPILVLGDTHFPFHSRRALDAVYSIAAKIQPEYIVQIGDLFDFYSASAFPGSHNVMTPKQELEEARGGAEEMWKILQKRAPKAKCYQLWGNHDVRPRKRVMESIPHLEHFFEAGIKDVMTFPGVSTVCTDIDDLTINGIVFEHGYTKPGGHTRNNQCSTVVGHLHRGYCLFEQVRVVNPNGVNNWKVKLLWELNAGYLGDPTSVAFDYKRKRFAPWTIGYGLIDALGPRFCPLNIV
jgi:predicted phosphodiesterase